jgi:D-serine deaminase-like pyridoxal phosphate-dependent protein
VPDRRRHRQFRIRGGERGVCDEPAATYKRSPDEHGRLAVSAATNRLGLGDKIRLIPGHCDPTVNLYPHPSLPRERGRVREGALVFCVLRQPRRTALADHRKGRGALTGAAPS